MREFIYDFNKRDFDRKTVLFLNFLLKHSKLTRDSSNKRILQLPDQVPYKAITKRTLIPHFTIIPLKQIGPKQPLQITTRIINKEKRTKLVRDILAWKYEGDQITHWTNIAFQKIKEEGELQFASLFYQILKDEANFSIATKTAHQVLKLSLKRKELKVQIEQEKIKDDSFPNTSIWKMEIRKI